MVQFYDSIPAFLVPWIQQQKIFFVATAPLAQDGHVNVSPKGFEGTFHVRDECTVWYEDLSGSGIETIAHIRENGRITVMFVAFEGPPRIARLFGTGTIYEFGTPEYDALLPPVKRQPGSRAVVEVHVHKASASCGYSIPFFEYKAPRMKLHISFFGRELADIQAESELEAQPCLLPSAERVLPPRPEKGLKRYWVVKNRESIDGLPGLKIAFNSWERFMRGEGEAKGWKDGELVKMRRGCGGWAPDGRMLMGFGAGLLVSAVCVRFGVV